MNVYVHVRVTKTVNYTLQEKWLHELLSSRYIFGSGLTIVSGFLTINAKNYGLLFYLMNFYVLNKKFIISHLPTHFNIASIHIFTRFLI